MRKESLFYKWIKWNEENYLFFSHFILFFVALSFVLSDWMYGYFTFSEYLLFGVSFILFITAQYRISFSQMKGLALTICFLGVHLAIQFLMNDTFEARTGIAGSLKLLFYLFIIVGLYNYLKRNFLENSFLIWNNFLGIVVILLGIYITYQLYKETLIPQEVFWRFTRRDIYSFYFESNPAIIRTRSIFSEPAHLGFYLNTLSAINLLNKKKVTIHPLFTCFLSLGVIITFSYSMIAIMGVIHILHLLLLIKEDKFLLHKSMLVIPVILFLVAILFWETINVTLVQRTLAILSGDDISARMRIFDSWQYVTRENAIIGNGIGHTPIVTNVYAYLLSDLGVTGLAAGLFISCWMLLKNFSIGIIFVLLHIAKGGYLSSSYWLMILLIIFYGLSAVDRDKLFNTTKKTILNL